MFQAVVITDLHLQNTELWGKALPTGINSRTQDKLDYIKLSVQYALDNKVDYWICLGDIFHKINPSESLRSQFIQAISPLIGKIPMFFLIGNHDTDNQVFSMMTEKSLFEALNLNDDIFIIESFSQFELGDVNCAFIPWATDEIVSKNLIEAPANSLIFGHFGVSGSMASGTEFILSEGINPGLFDKHMYAYLGHYHRFQSYPKYMYVGSIARMDLSERDDPKGFAHIKVTSAGVKHKFINVPDKRMIVHKVLQADDPSFSQLYEWDELQDAIVKVEFIGERDWFYSFNKGEITTRLTKLGAHKFAIEHQSTTNKTSRVPEVDASTSWLDGLQVYCKKMNRPDMLNIGKEILSSVLK